MQNLLTSAYISHPRLPQQNTKDRNLNNKNLFLCSSKRLGVCDQGSKQMVHDVEMSMSLSTKPAHSP